MVNHDGQVESNQPAEILEMICSMNYEFISSHGGCGWLAGHYRSHRWWSAGLGTNMPEIVISHCRWQVSVLLRMSE